MHMVRCAGTCGSCHGVACKPPFPAEVDLSVRGLCSNADVLCLGYTQSTAFNHVGIRMTQRRSAGRSNATFIEIMCFNPFYSSGNPRGCPVVSCSSNRWKHVFLCWPPPSRKARDWKVLDVWKTVCVDFMRRNLICFVFAFLGIPGMCSACSLLSTSLTNQYPRTWFAYHNLLLTWNANSQIQTWGSVASLPVHYGR